MSRDVLQAESRAPVRLVVDASTGAVAQRIDYDEFGRVLQDTHPGFQPFGYAGGLYDPDTGLVRFGARDYDPEVGRWTAKDPVLFEDSTNVYSYALTDPLNLRDPTGSASVTAQAFAGIGGRVTFGFDKNGDFFAEIGGGFGIGADFSFDPFGEPLPAECDEGKDVTAGLTFLANAGFGAGPFGAEASANASGVLNTPACGCVDADASATLSPSAFKDASGKLKFGGVASVTVNLTAFRGNRLRR